MHSRPLVLKSCVLLLSLTIVPIFVYAQPPENQRELNGYLLGQRHSVLTKIGKPYKQVKSRDGWIDEVHLVNGENYMVFGFRKAGNEQMLSIQITGGPYAEMRPFLGLRLGDSKEKVVSALGKPTEIKHVSDVNVDEYRYDPRNYSVEIDSKGKLSSIRIGANEWYFKDVEFAKQSPVGGLRKALETCETDELVEQLSGDAEFYLGEETIEFNSSVFQELQNKNSRFVQLLCGGKGSLREALLTENTEEDIQMRVYEKHSPAIVAKFPNSKIVSEIVFDAVAGKWRVYEVQFR